MLEFFKDLYGKLGLRFVGRSDIITSINSLSPSVGGSVTELGSVTDRARCSEFLVPSLGQDILARNSRRQERGGGPGPVRTVCDGVRQLLLQRTPGKLSAVTFRRVSQSVSLTGRAGQGGQVKRPGNMIFKTWFSGLGISTLGPGFSHSRFSRPKPEKF